MNREDNKIKEQEEVLSADLVLWPYEILAEFRERCEEATTKPGTSLPELKQAAATLCRMLDREDVL